MTRHSSKFIAPALFVLLLDQAIKFLAVNKIIGLEFSKNSGALFGIQLNVNFIFVFFAVFLFVAIICFKQIKTSSPSPRCSLSAEPACRSEGFKQIKLLKSDAIALMAFYLMLGGIVSNLTDRILYGQIIDYLNLFNLFSFNIADLAICFGALILSWKVFKQ